MRAYAKNKVKKDFEKGRGRIVGFIGENGAGKSTLLNIITCNLRPSGGVAEWDGEDIVRLGTRYRAILGYAPQQSGMYDAVSGRRFVSYMAALKGIPKKALGGEVDRVLSYVNMSSAADRPIGTYSGGMKQRILIAQAILGDPKLIVLDEPTAGLDPKERVRVRERIFSLSEDRIILISTHVVSDIESIAKEIILIRSGALVDRGPVCELCSKYHAAGLEDVYMKLFGEDEGEEEEEGEKDV